MPRWLTVLAIVVALLAPSLPALASPAAGKAAAASKTAVAGKTAAASKRSAPARPAAQKVPYTPAPCNKTPAKKGFVQCFAYVRTGADHQIKPDAVGPPVGSVGPAQIQQAYGLPSTGPARTVAVVDAYGYYTAESDLAAFRSYYGLPACTTKNGCFRKVDQSGGSAAHLPDDPGWAIETALDLDAISSACPSCHILLVEADDSNITSMAAAAQTAATLGARYISNSYGVPGEVDGEQTLDHDYTHTGVAVVASSGDLGNITSWPATSPEVVSAGGTSLIKTDGYPNGWYQGAWGDGVTGGSGGGSGCSPYEPKPSYQQGIATGCDNRASADVAADADPATGLAIYDSYRPGGWLQVGGTSLASPLIAAMYALAGTPAPGTYPVSYLYQHPADLYDITGGSNGNCGNVLCNAGPGWDGPTGLGAPNGLAALRDIPHGDITGVVTDAHTGRPVQSATVSASTGSATTAATTTTGADGRYDLAVPAGSYAVTAVTFDYTAATSSPIAVTEGKAASANLALASIPLRTLTGTVTDGSGHGWPLYARVGIEGFPGDAVYTDPATGKFKVELPERASYNLHVSSALLPGYTSADLQVSLGATDASRRIALTADQDSCSAPGYKFDGFYQPFTGWAHGKARDGWRITNNLPPSLPGGATWNFSLSYRVVPPGDDWNFAAAHPDTERADTSLISPVMNLSGQAAPEIGFDSNYFSYGSKTQAADVDLSIDGGQTWTAIWHRGVQPDPNVPSERVDIGVPQAAGQARVQVRFHLVNTYQPDNLYAGWWAVDNVLVGTRHCLTTPGGLLAGVVRDANTGRPVDTATVAPAAAPASAGTTGAQPAGNGIPDGYYWVFAPRSGRQPFTATAGGYVRASAQVQVAGNGLTRQNWTLRAGRVAVSAGGITAATPMGGVATRQITVRNTGTASVRVHLGGQDAGFTPAVAGSAKAAPAQGTAAARVRAVPVRRVKLASAPDPRDFRAPAAASGAAAPAASGGAWRHIADYPIPIAGNAAASDGATIYSAGGITDADSSEGGSFVASAYGYSLAANRWHRIANPPQALAYPAGAYLGGRFYLVGGFTFPPNYASRAVYAYDPARNAWTRAADLPLPLGNATAAVLDGKLYIIGGYTTAFSSPADPWAFRYDPAANTWTRIADYPVPLADGACAGIAGEVVCAGGWSAGTDLASTYIYHPASNTWTQGADMPYDGWAMAHSGANGKLQLAGGIQYGVFYLTNQSIEYDPARDVWTALPNANAAEYYGGSSCGFAVIGGSGAASEPDHDSQRYTELLPGYGNCGSTARWLSVSRNDLTLAPGQSARVTVRMHAAVGQPGDYRALVWLDGAAPYQVKPVQVRMRVKPPAGWGQITGTVTDAAAKTALSGATVRICVRYSAATGRCGKGYTLRTDPAGRYELWLPAADNPLQAIAAADGYGMAAKVARINRGAAVTVNFALKQS